MKIIPAIDILDGSCVRLLKGNFDKALEILFSLSSRALSIGFQAYFFNIRINNMKHKDIQKIRPISGDTNFIN